MYAEGLWEWLSGESVVAPTNGRGAVEDFRLG